MPEVTGHGGDHAVAAALDSQQDVMWTLSGAHVFPLYDAVVKRNNANEPSMRIVDTRHEATAVFAAEASGKLTRNAGLAVVTAGPGVTNTVSGIASAKFNGSPLVVIGGRAPDNRWGMGALQELDQPPLVEPITKAAFTIHDVASGEFAQAFATANSAHRGPVFVDVPMDALYMSGTAVLEENAPDPVVLTAEARQELDRLCDLLAKAQNPVLVLGGDVWLNHAETAARHLAQSLGLPTITNGMARGVLPGDDGRLVTRARKQAFTGADLVIVVGTPLDFRLGYGQFGDGSTPVAHIMDSEAGLARHTNPAAAVGGDLSTILTQLATVGPQPSWSKWLTELRETATAAQEADQDMLTSAANPIHPARIYGELNSRLTDDTVVIGDGGDFVSFAGRFVEPARPGNWLDPGPYGCLGTGLGYAMSARIHRPDSPVVLLMGDGAAGFSLMDIDTLVRHNLPVVMVVGNNSAWGLEKHPMKFLYGYDVAADLLPTRYDEVAKDLGAEGEAVTDPDQVGPAMDRAFASGKPYLINVMMDQDIPYPRTTTGV